MDLAFAATLASAVLTAVLAAISIQLARAQIWRDLARVWPVGAATALLSFFALAEYAPVSAGLFDAFARLQFSSALLLGFAWLRYSATALGGAPARGERRIAFAVVAAAVIVLVPGVGIDATRIHAHVDPISARAWRDSTLTPLGHALLLAAMGLACWAIARLARAWRRGDRRAGIMVIATAAGMAAAVVDYLVRLGAAPAPHLLAPAATVPVMAAAWVLGLRFVSDADALHDLRGRLEGLVEERTRELAETHSALLQAEKLAALGQFAAGVAHEVNNPASVVTSNLGWLSDGLAKGLAAPVAKDVVDESLDAMQRINDLVRKLLDAGRLADLPPGSGSVVLARTVEQALDALRGRGRLDVELVNGVADDLLVRGLPDVVERIVANLIANAVDAIPPDRRGRVEVRAVPVDRVVRLIVEDDGVGMAVDVLRRAFDPFFTTKPVGRGSGLGLPITRGLVEGIGGEIWLESEPGKGTRAAVELPLATPA